MFDTNSITRTATATSGIPATTSSSNSTAMSKDQFLKLLVAQLKNQDPLAAPDASKMAEQMTAFGQLEQLFNLNSTMDSVASMQGSAIQNQAVSMIGRTVEVQGNGLTITGADKGSIGISLSGEAKTVSVNVRNAAGQVVRTMQYTPQVGNTFYTFDGKDADGNDLPDGNYSFDVSAIDSTGNEIVATELMRGTVTGVSFGENGPELQMGSQTLNMSDILSVVG